MRADALSSGTTATYRFSELSAEYYITVARHIDRKRGYFIIARLIDFVIARRHFLGSSAQARKSAPAKARAAVNISASLTTILFYAAHCFRHSRTTPHSACASRVASSNYFDGLIRLNAGQHERRGAQDDAKP